MEEVVENEDKCAAKTSSVQIAAFVVLDLETNNLPDFNFGKVSITEVSMYGFLAKELKAENILNLNEKVTVTPSKTPRLLNKLTLLFNPNAMIHPNATDVTMLDNYILQDFPLFTEATANLLLNWIKQLPQPTCLVAHNGYRFDFAILKATLNKFNVELPAETLCVDSLRAFCDIDEKIRLKNIDLESSEKVDWQEINENTPKRSSSTNLNPNNKMRKLCTDNTSPTSEPTITKRATCSARRDLFNSKEQNGITNETPLQRITKKYYVPKDLYKLGNIYKRKFGEAPNEVHFAEADVDSLMRLMLLYGNEFLNYAEEQAVPFSDIPINCRSTN